MVRCRVIGTPRGRDGRIFANLLKRKAKLKVFTYLKRSLRPLSQPKRE